MVKKGSEQHVNSDYEIMIVGGGPAGISTWLHLQKHNPDLAAKCVLIEKAKYPREKLCGGALHKWMTTKILNNLNIQVTIPSVSIDTIEIHFGSDIYKYQENNFFRIIRRIEFDNLLAKTAIKRGLQLHENEQFLDMNRCNNKLLIKTNKGIYNVKVLVGADGALSLVRRKMNMSIQPHFAATIEIFSPLNPTYDPEFSKKTAVLDFSAVNQGLQGYVWHFPCLYDDKPIMNHGICDTRIIPDTTRPDMKKIFKEELTKRHITREIKSWSGHPITYLPDGGSLSQPNILLVGDAAGIEPLLCGGIHLALAYGEVAATTISNSFQNNDFSLIEYTQIIQNHYLGKYIQKFTAAAKYIYTEKTKILDTFAKIMAYKK